MRSLVTRLSLLAGLAVGGCDVSFEPITASDRYFSLSGYLDASADTQWVRVEPVAPDVDPRPDPLDVVVTLEDPAANTATAMAQRVRTLRTGPAHLFWTTADVRPGTTYRLVVRRPDGAETRATVEVPPVEAVEIDVGDGPTQCPVLIYVRGADRLADVQTRYTVFGADGEGDRHFRFSKIQTLTEDPDGTLRTRFYYGDDAEDMGLTPFPLPPEVVRTEVTVALGTDDWPDPLGLDLETALILAPSERIENGVGFVGGTVTETQAFVPGALPVGFGDWLPCLSPR